MRDRITGKTALLAMNTPSVKRFPGAKLLFVGLAAVAVAIVGWRLLARETSSRAETPTELRVPILASSALQTLDPIKSAELVQYNLDLQIFECLVGVGSDGRIVPALAESWEAAADFKTWTFRLREARFADDACFPGGKARPVTVDDVIFSWKRGLNPKLGSLNSWALSSSVAGAAAFARGESEEVGGLRKIDARTLRVELTEPDREFLTRLTVLSTAIVAPEATQRYGDQFGNHPVGSGPFRLKAWSPGEYVLLERNPSYGQGAGWQPKAPKLDRVHFAFFRSEAQIAQAFADGRADLRAVTGADLARLPSPAAEDGLRQLYPQSIVVRPGSVCSLHLLAPVIGPGAAFGESAALRRELAATFNHAQLIASAVGPLGRPTKTLALPRGILVDGFPEAAETSAGGAHAPLGPSPLRGRVVKIAYASSRIDDITVELLRQWIEQRGGTARVFPSASINALFASIGEVKPDLTLIYWSPYYPNVANFVTALLSFSRPVPNFTGFSNPALDEAARKLKTADEAAAEQARAAIRRILDEEMPWIPLYYETPLYVTTPRVRNFRISPVSVMLLAETDLGTGDTASTTRP